MGAMGVEGRNGRVGKGLPPTALMASGLMGTHREGGIEQQHALLGPPRQVAVGGHRRSDIRGYLLEDIDERGGHHDTAGHGETESHGLPLLVIRVLPDDDHLDLVEGTQVEGIEDELSRRITACLLIL